MTKRIMAKTDEYQKDGETKGKYTEVGVILSNSNGEYVLLNPDVSLAGTLAKQNALEFKKGGEMRSNIMCSIFEQDNNQAQQQGGHQQQGGFNNNQQGGFNQQPQQQGGFPQQNQPPF